MHYPFCRHLGSRVLDSRSTAFGRAQLPAREVVLAVLGPLRDLDEVAYLRFALVYCGFESLGDFEAKIRRLRAEREPTPHEDLTPFTANQ